MTTGLLLIHAFPLDASMWQPQVDALKDRVRVVAPNMPGFGGEPSVGPVTTMEAAAATATRALNAAGLDQAVVCGLSMGGYIALSMWRDHRERVLGLVLANTRAEADTEDGRTRRIALANRLMREGSGFLVENPPPILGPGAPDALRQRVRETIKRQPAESIAAASRGMADRMDFTGELHAVGVPTLVISSSADALIPAPTSRAMCERVPRARYEEIPGAGHLSNLEAPEDFNRLLLEHLVKCGVVPRAS